VQNFPLCSLVKKYLPSHTVCLVATCFNACLLFFADHMYIDLELYSSDEAKTVLKYQVDQGCYGN